MLNRLNLNNRLNLQYTYMTRHPHIQVVPFPLNGHRLHQSKFHHYRMRMHRKTKLTALGV